SPESQFFVFEHMPLRNSALPRVKPSKKISTQEWRQQPRLQRPRNSPVQESVQPTNPLSSPAELVTMMASYLLNDRMSLSEIRKVSRSFRAGADRIFFANIVISEKNLESFATWYEATCIEYCDFSNVRRMNSSTRKSVYQRCNHGPPATPVRNRLLRMVRHVAFKFGNLSWLREVLDQDEGNRAFVMHKLSKTLEEMVTLQGISISGELGTRVWEDVQCAVKKRVVDKPESLTMIDVFSGFGGSDHKIAAFEFFALRKFIQGEVCKVRF
ncbi:hypothetical protein HDU76_012163, partial [Blyttiomyces sp. JEL0837]